MKQHRHYGHHVVVAYLAVALVITPVPLPQTLGVILGTILVVVVATGAIANLRHLRGDLCQECITSMPLNAQEKADKAKRLLWVSHLLSDGLARVIAYSAVLLGLVGAQVVLSLTSAPYSASYVITQELSLALLLVATVAFRTHSKYGPWCPYCNGGGGGEGHRASSPDPTIPQPA